VLDDLNDYHPELWALGKIYAYSIQEKPFIHVDSDVYIWKKFDDDLENASLLCQSKEEGDPYSGVYSRIFFNLVKHVNYYPRILERSIDRNEGFRAINAGILGGHNIDFYKKYTKEAFEFVNRNIDKLDKIDVGSFNIIFEQFLFFALKVIYQVIYLSLPACLQPPVIFIWPGFVKKTSTCLMLLNTWCRPNTQTTTIKY
jgi:hypothetical protein